MNVNSRSLSNTQRSQKPRPESSSPEKKGSSTSGSPTPRNLSPRRPGRRTSRDRSPRRNKRNVSPRSRLSSHIQYRSPPHMPPRMRRARSRSQHSNDSRRRHSRHRDDRSSPGLIDASTRRKISDGERYRGGGDASDEKPRYRGADGEGKFTREELKTITVDIRRTVPAELLSGSRNFVNPQDIVVWRRPGEGLRPLFDREELASAGPAEERRVISSSPRRDSRRNKEPLDRSSGRERLRLDTRFPVRRRTRSRSPSRSRRRSRSPSHRGRDSPSRHREEQYPVGPVMVQPQFRLPLVYRPPRRPYVVIHPHMARPPFPRIFHPRVPVYFQYPQPRMYPPHYRMP